MNNEKLLFYFKFLFSFENEVLEKHERSAILSFHLDVTLSASSAKKKKRKKKMTHIIHSPQVITKPFSWAISDCIL